MKKSDAHAFVMLALQDHITRLSQTDKAAAQSLAEKLQTCMQALAPVPEPEPTAAQDHG